MPTLHTISKIYNLEIKNQDIFEIRMDDIKDKQIYHNTAITLKGFICSKNNIKIKALESTAKGIFGREHLGDIKLTASPGFADIHKEYKYANNAKFFSKLHSAFMYENDLIHVYAAMEDNTQKLVLSFNIETKCDILHKYTEQLSPIKLLSLGRTGTTSFMNMLSAHPKIGINNFFNESNILSYFIGNTKYAYPTLQKNFYSEGRANLQNIEALEKNEYIEFPFIKDDVWYNYFYPKKVITDAKQMVDEYYLNIEKKNISYFIEKGVVHDPSLTMMYKMYSKSKFIFLVRDFRDMYASILSFNKKRGFRAFGMENYEKDEDYIAALSKYCENSFIDAIEALRDRAILVKYEDLIMNKHTTLKSIFEYLGIDSFDAILDDLMEKTSGKSKNEQEHMTAGDIGKSIGKYKDTLDDATIDLLNKNFKYSLTYFNYD